MERSSLKIKLCGRFMIKPIGKVNLVLENINVKISSEFNVIETNTKPIMYLMNSKIIKYVDNGNFNSNTIV